MNNSIRKDTVQTGPLNDSQPPAQPREAVQPGPVVPGPPPPQPKYEVALLDLHNASATRTVDPAGPSPNIQPIEIPRGLLALTVQLPVGSDADTYEVQIRDSNQQPIQTAKGEAAIENGITKLHINVDTRPIQPGEYDFAWRRGDFSWRHHPILIR